MDRLIVGNLKMIISLLAMEWMLLISASGYFLSPPFVVAIQIWAAYERYIKTPS